MGFDLMDVFVKVGADTSGLESGLDSAKNLASGFGSALSAGVKGAGVAIAAVGTAVVGTGAALVKGTGDVAAYGDNIDKMSQKMGISAQGYQEWEAVMQHSGTSMETLKSGMKTLANAVEKGNESFEKIGITQEEIANMSNEDLFNATIAGLQNVEDETQRTYLAGQLLGKGATELGALLNTSAEDTQAMKDRVHELGGVMSDDAVKAAAAYQDQLQDMQTAFQGLGRNLLSEFMPSLTSVMGGLTEIFTGNYDKGLDQISEGIDEVIDNITDKVPEVLEVGGKIIEALAKSVVENAPKVLPALTELVMSLGETLGELIPDIIDVGVELVETVGSSIVENAPQLLEQVLVIGEELAGAALELMGMFTDSLAEFDWAGAAQGIVDYLSEALTGDSAQSFIETAVSMITNLVSGLVQAIPILIPAAVDIIMDLAGFILDNIDTVIDCGIDLIVALTEGVINAIPVLVEKMPEIIEKLVTAVAENAPKLVAAFIEMVLALGEAIVTNIPTLVSNMVQLGAQLLSALAKWGGELVSKMGENMSKLISKAVEWLQKLPEKLAYYAGVGVRKFVEFIKQLPTKAKETFNNVLSKVKEFATDFVKKAPEMAKKFKDDMLEKLNELPDKMIEVGKNVIEGLKKGIENAWESFKQWIIDKATGIVGAFMSGLKESSPSKAMMDVGENAVKGLQIGMDDEWKDVEDTVNAYTELIKQPIETEPISFATDATGLGKGFDNVEENTLTIDEMAEAFIKALERYGLTVEMDHREFGRIVRKEAFA